MIFDNLIPPVHLDWLLLAGPVITSTHHKPALIALQTASSTIQHTAVPSALKVTLIQISI